MQLFLDSDGVMYDFDERAYQLLGMNPRRYEKEFGAGAFWKVLKADEEFFKHLNLRYDAMELFNRVRHLDPIILTGIPINWDSASDQKRAAFNRDFGEVKVITCPSKDKCLYMKPGDIIIDDWPKHKQKWIEKGGIWIDHFSAEYSIDALKALNIL